MSETIRYRAAGPAHEGSLPKRFYTSVEVVEEGDGHSVRLDGRPVRTPGRALLALPNAATAAAVAREWDAQRKWIDPRTMPATRLANTALDGVANEMQGVKEDVVRYAGSDLVCYRADAPPGLVERESAMWDPFVEWAQRTIGANFVLAEGVVHVAQPAEAIAAISAAVGLVRDPFRLAALHVMTSLTGSAIIALAVLRGDSTVDRAWAAAHVDEDWNIAQWGEDEEASLLRARREEEMRVAAFFATA